MSAGRNSAELYAIPGENVTTFYVRCCYLAREINGTVFGTHNGTRVACTPEMIANEAVRAWERKRR